MPNSICIFCGSSDKIDTSYLSAAHQMGIAVAKRGDKIIYGGGSTGLMVALANGALQNRGEVIGVLPRLFDTPQLAHTNLTRMEIVRSIKKSRDDLNQTYVIISHDIDFVLAACDRAALMKDGQVLKVGEPVEIIEYFKEVEK